MRVHTVLVGVGCLVVGVLVTALTPRVTAQAQPDPCQAPWDVVSQGWAEGGNGDQGGWSAVKWNHCTGEAFVFSVGRSSKYDASAGVWSKNPVK